MASKRPELKLYELGYYLDGWADLVENMGGKAAEVRKLLGRDLKRRKMPDVKIRQVDGIPKPFSKESRLYGAVTTDPGATTTVYVGKRGLDLYISWRTFFKMVPNWELVKRLLQIAGVIGGGYFLLNSIEGLWLGISRGIFGSESAKQFWEVIWTFIFWGIVGIIIYFVGNVIAILISPLVRKPLQKIKNWRLWLIIGFLVSLIKEFSGYRIHLPNHYRISSEILIPFIFWFLLIFFFGIIISSFANTFFDFPYIIDDENYKSKIKYTLFITFIVYSFFVDWSDFFNNISRMGSTFGNYFMGGISSISFGLILFLQLFLGGLGLLLIGGLLLHRSPLYFLLVQPTIFDADDISAMTLAVHKSVLRVLDESGIDISKLRLKEKFTGGRKGEDI
ncbi:MAG: hypothetical protein HN950_02020 [Chloroflexi bacterium]|nr:hypothetical protein [Chloroflexota bacterium]MBT6988058.1 hypothetical protein [Chloroflexota bacterium]